MDTVNKVGARVLAKQNLGYAIAAFVLMALTSFVAVAIILLQGYPAWAFVFPAAYLIYPGIWFTTALIRWEKVKPAGGGGKLEKDLNKLYHKGACGGDS